MKTLFAVALLASVFTFTSCGNKPADTAGATTTTTSASTTAAPAATPTAGTSLVDRAVDCTCKMVNAAAALKKEIEAAPEDKKEELIAKASEEIEKLTCMTDLEAEMGKIPKAEQVKIETEAKAAVEKKCGAEMKALDMPIN